MIVILWLGFGLLAIPILALLFLLSALFLFLLPSCAVGVCQKVKGRNDSISEAIDRHNRGDCPFFSFAFSELALVISIAAASADLRFAAVFFGITVFLGILGWIAS